MTVAKCGQGWTNNPCKHESTIQDCIQCICIHGDHARDCGMTPSETEKDITEKQPNQANGGQND